MPAIVLDILFPINLLHGINLIVLIGLLVITLDLKTITVLQMSALVNDRLGTLAQLASDMVELPKI